MKKITMLEITGLLKLLGINFYDIIDEIVDVNNEIFQY